MLPRNKKDILSRWAENFSCLFGYKRSVQESSILKIPQQQVKAELYDPPDIEEVKIGVRKLKTRKGSRCWRYPSGSRPTRRGPTPGNDLNPVSIVLGEGRNAKIVSLYKNKGEKSDCSNYRGIILLSMAGKILARVLLNRLIRAIAEDILPESQYGFRANRGTADIIFVLRQIQENFRE